MSCCRAVISNVGDHPLPEQSAAAHNEMLHLCACICC